MALTADPARADVARYARSPDEVSTAFGVDPAVGLTGPKVEETPRADGPNALPEEKPKPGWQRFLEASSSPGGAGPEQHSRRRGRS